jgi:predicted RNase H-like HicB family nuclease
MKIEIDREDDGRWIAEVPDLPGVMVYGKSREEAISKVKALALRALADRLEFCIPRSRRDQSADAGPNRETHRPEA